MENLQTEKTDSMMLVFVLPLIYSFNENKCAKCSPGHTLNSTVPTSNMSLLL